MEKTLKLKETEIRIGNWVIDNYKKQFQFSHADFVDMMWEVCEPIPLTPEILLNNGWEKYVVWFKYGDLHIQLFGNISIETWVTPYRTPIYVHQLQNVIYDLTGQEWEIKL